VTMATSPRLTTPGAHRTLRPGDIRPRLADPAATRSRRPRGFQAFERLVEELAHQQTRPVRILDLGGTNSFWEHHGWTGRDDVEIVLVNLEAEARVHANIEPRVGDATDLGDLPNWSFDIVFSNSVIEELQTSDRQAAMASEVSRLAPCYWIQTRMRGRELKRMFPDAMLRQERIRPLVKSFVAVRG
jgi:hypothetical protein